MDIVWGYWNEALSLYGAEGLALVAALAALLVVQLGYYAGSYRRVASYRNNRLPARLEQEPPVSVVLTAGDDLSFLEERLPPLLTQDHAQYEVVVVYLGEQEELFARLLAQGERYGHLTVTKIRRDARFPISNKQALNVGIKAARYEHILLTTSDTILSSERWVRLMAKGFTRGDVVLGYCGVERGRGLANRMMRTQRMMHSVQWLSRAVGRRPYRGIRNSLGFTRSLYFGTRGFNFLNMNIGEDDLFIRKIVSPANVSIILSPRATVRQRAWGSLGWWLRERRRYAAAYPFYPRAARNSVEWEAGSRLLFFAAAAAALAWLPLELKAGAALLVALRYGVVLWSVGRIRRRLGERGLAGTYFLYDLFSPFFGLGLGLVRRLRKDETVWK